MSEEWRPVAQRPDRYEVSNLGRVRSVFKSREPRILKPHLGGFGYHRYAFKIDGKNRYFDVHRLVAAAFLGEPSGPVVRHLDGNPDNNAAVNLAYGTIGDNNKDMVRHGTHHNAAKTHCPYGHEYDAFYVSKGRARRGCKECMRASSARYRLRKSA